jgi:hypothetical protein
MATFIDLVLDNGNVVRIECKTRDEDEVREALENAMRSGGWWAPGRWDGCKAEYLGNRLDRVNMGRVVGGM